MLHATGPGNVRNMNKAINAVFDLNERSEVSQVAHSSMHARANLISIVKRLPGVLLHLLHPQTDPSSLGINSKNLDVNNVSGVDDLARMLHTLGPTHL